MSIATVQPIAILPTRHGHLKIEIDEEVGLDLWLNAASFFLVYPLMYIVQLAILTWYIVLHYLAHILAQFDPRHGIDLH